MIPGGGPKRLPKARVLAELQVRSKLGGEKKRPSDEVEGLKFVVRWEPSKGAFGVKVGEEDVRVEEWDLRVVSCSFFFFFFFVVRGRAD
jgi:mediator of RNA polymerase II transcription subunit 14